MILDPDGMGEYGFGGMASVHTTSRVRGQLLVINRPASLECAAFGDMARFEEAWLEEAWLEDVEQSAWTETSKAFEKNRWQGWDLEHLRETRLEYEAHLQIFRVR
jgi:hypothetical protein